VSNVPNEFVPKYSFLQKLAFLTLNTNNHKIDHQGNRHFFSENCDHNMSMGFLKAVKTSSQFCWLQLLFICLHFAKILKGLFNHLRSYPFENIVLRKVHKNDSPVKKLIELWSD
jgi:hypothetical protein